MVQSISPNKSTTSDQIVISDIANIKLGESYLLEFQCWQAYYEDLSKAAMKISSLTKK